MGFGASISVLTALGEYNLVVMYASVSLPYSKLYKVVCATCVTSQWQYCACNLQLHIVTVCYKCMLSLHALCLKQLCLRVPRN